MRIGFIGVGIMGRPMAGHLQAAGHELFLVRHRSPLPPELIERGAVACADNPALAEAVEVVFLMVPDTAAVEATLFGPSGVAEGLSPGKGVVDMSSIDPEAERRFAGRIAELGCDYIDAPVSGGEVGAREASLSIMCGAAETAFARVRPLLELMGRNVTRVGEAGAGQVAKAANQIIVGLGIHAVAEALVFASKAGADPAKVRQALMGGFAASRILDLHGERMIQRNFTPGGVVAFHQKDLTIAVENARRVGAAVPATATTLQLFNACVGLGGAGWDHSALVKALEVLAAHKVAEDPES